MSAGQKEPSQAAKGKVPEGTTKRADAVPIQQALLQKHRSLCSQLTLVLFGCRALCVLATIYFVLAPSVTVFTVAAVGASFVLLLCFWAQAEERVGKAIHAVEAALAQAAGGKWEDTFILTKRPDEDWSDADVPAVAFCSNLFHFLFRREKPLWTLMLATLIVLRVLAQSCTIFSRYL